MMETINICPTSHTLSRTLLQSWLTWAKDVPAVEAKSFLRRRFLLKADPGIGNASSAANAIKH
jgi:hypothetical protein